LTQFLSPLSENPYADLLTGYAGQVNSVELSILIPVYNGEDFIGPTIDSVLEYSEGFNVECIVIDDGSNDSTPILLQEYGQKIRTFHQSNMGESAAVNKGLELARGQYAVVVSADDPIMTSGLFTGVVKFFENNPKVVAWYPDWAVIDGSGNLLKAVRLPEFDFEDLFSRNIVLPGPGTWFRVQTALEIGGRRIRWKYVGDYDFWLRLSRYGRIEHRPELLAQWRKHLRSTSISERGPLMAWERVRVIEEFISEYQNTLDKKSTSLALAHANFLAARLGFFSSEVNSRKLFFKAIKLDARVLKSIKYYEAIFMLAFPFSKYLTDASKNFMKKYVK
jgi:glycosyltransferase involved in cell wall biosynthesis